MQIPIAGGVSDGRLTSLFDSDRDHTRDQYQYHVTVGILGP